MAAQSQNQSVADSLVEVYNAIDENDTARFRLLTLIANNQNDPRVKLEYADLLLAEANKAKDDRYLHHAYLNQGQAYRITGDFDIAIYSLFKALNYAEKAKYSKGIAAANTALADVYSLLGNHTNSIIYYKKAVDWLSKGDSSLLANILLNMGDEYYVSGVYDSALVAFEESRN
ncbi:MAG: tetratricopeptide repeat protein, partial [Marinoscillum sp.]